jgi:hypothetical protein
MSVEMQFLRAALYLLSTRDVKHVQRMHTSDRKEQFTNTKLITTAAPHYLVREQNFLEAGRIKLPRRAVLLKLIRRVVYSHPCAVQL